MSPRLARALWLMWLLGSAAMFLAWDPVQALRMEKLREGLQAAVATGVWLVAAVGAGGAALQRLAPALLEDEDGGLHALGAGLLLWGLLLGGIAAAGGLTSAGLIGAAALLGAGWLARPSVRWPRLPGAVLAALAVVVGVGLVDALAPAVTTDELYYHLALPREMLRTGGLVGGVLRPDGSRPMILHLPFAAVLSSGGSAAPRLLHLALSCALLAGVARVGRRHLGAAAGVWAVWMLVASWSVLGEVGLAANNLPAALAALLALDCALRGEARALAVQAGLALSIKYTAAGVITGIFLAARLPWSARIAAGAAALLVVSPWWALNATRGVHPLFPFAGWSGDMAFQYMEKYGLGRTPLDLLRLPLDAVFRAEIGSFRLLGRLSPLLAAALPLGVLAAARGAGESRRVGGAALVVLVAWASGPHWLRYLLPGLPVVVLALAAGSASLERLGRAGLVGVLLAGMPANWGPLARHVADRLPAALGQESREAYLARTEETWPTIAWANTHLPPDAVVGMLYVWTGGLLERPYLLSSVEDHIPVRHWLLTHGPDSLQALRQAGATHLIVGRTLPLRKVYPFLSDAVFEQEFEEPSRLLEALLLQEAVLIYEEKRTRVYRLDGAQKDP